MTEIFRIWQRVNFCHKFSYSMTKKEIEELDIYQPMLMIGGASEASIKLKNDAELTNLINDIANREEEDEGDLKIKYDSLVKEKNKNAKTLEEIRDQISNETQNSKKLDTKLDKMKRDQALGDEKLKNFENRIKHYTMLQERLLDLIQNELTERGFDSISNEDKIQIIQELTNNQESSLLTNLFKKLFKE